MNEPTVLQVKKNSEPIDPIIAARELNKLMTKANEQERRAIALGGVLIGLVVSKRKGKVVEV